MLQKIEVIYQHQNNFVELQFVSRKLLRNFDNRENQSYLKKGPI